MDKNQGYSILKAVMLENGRGFALGEHPTAHPAMSHGPVMMTKTGLRQYEWGHYGNDRTAMEQDFTDRVQDYQRIYNVGIRQTEAPGLYKYYSTSGLWTSAHSRSRPITSRMKSSITISASRWKMARSWLGVILPIPVR